MEAVSNYCLLLLGAVLALQGPWVITLGECVEVGLRRTNGASTKISWVFIITSEVPALVCWHAMALAIAPGGVMTIITSSHAPSKIGGEGNDKSNFKGGAAALSCLD